MREELKSAFLNFNFVMGFLVMLICFLGMSIPEWVVSAAWGSEYRQSALQQSIVGIFFGGVMLLMPFCACIPYATRQVEELRTSVMTWKLLRSSLSKYATGKIMASALSGGAAVAAAFIIHALIWNLVALPCDPVAHPYHEISFDPNSLYAEWYAICYGLPMYLSITIGIFISGSTWAVIALAVSVWVPDKLLTVAIPACIYYLLSASILNHLFGWNLPHPATLYNDALTVQQAIQSFTEYVLLFIFACVLYRLGLRRRAQNE